MKLAGDFNPEQTILEVRRRTVGVDCGQEDDLIADLSRPPI
jgi:hypothetical protein